MKRLVVLLFILIVTASGCISRTVDNEVNTISPARTFKPVTDSLELVTETPILKPSTTSTTEGETDTGISLTPEILDTVAPTPTAIINATASPVEKTTMPNETVQSGQAIIVDHTSVALFDQIPQEYLEDARNIPMMFSDRSVGSNINDGLNCLAADTEWYRTPAHCRRDYSETDGSNWQSKTYSQSDYENGLVPERILFDPDPVIYNRSNWVFETDTGDWESLIEHFVQNLVPEHVMTKDVLSFQITYLNVDSGSTIDDQDKGFFVDLPSQNGNRWDISDLEQLELQYPDKIFIYWTSSLARSIGSEESENFNDQMRQYVMSRGKVLFDFADIISRDANGNLCYDNRDGVPYDNGNNEENYPDDGQNLTAICQDYTTETDGGHLGAVSGGKIRAAKAFWVLMAQLAGWNP